MVYPNSVLPGEANNNDNSSQNPTVLFLSNYILFASADTDSSSGSVVKICPILLARIEQCYALVAVEMNIVPKREICMIGIIIVIVMTMMTIENHTITNMM
eukprot:1451595-Ditylum_brightwellii.AAC.1